MKSRKSPGDEVVGGDGVTAGAGAAGRDATKASASTRWSSHCLWLKCGAIPTSAERGFDSTATVGQVVTLDDIFSKGLDLKCVSIRTGALVRASTSTARVVAIFYGEWDALSVGALACCWWHPITGV